MIVRLVSLRFGVWKHAAKARGGRRGSVVRQAVLRQAWSRQNRGYPFRSIQVMTTDKEASILSASFFVMHFEVMSLPTLPEGYQPILSNIIHSWYTGRS